MQLSVPNRTAPKNGSFNSKTASVKEWIDRLPMANIGATTRLLFEALTDLNQQDIPAQQRFKALEMLRKPVQFVTDHMKKHFVGQPLPLAAKNLKVARLSREITHSLATGYKVLVMEQLAGIGRSDRKLLVTAIHRATKLLGSVLLKAYQVYESYPDSVWLEIHSLYRYAEANDLHNTPVADEFARGRKGSTIADAYKQMLLLALAWMRLAAVDVAPADPLVTRAVRSDVPTLLLVGTLAAPLAPSLAISGQGGTDIVAVNDNLNVTGSFAATAETIQLNRADITSGEDLTLDGEVLLGSDEPLGRMRGRWHRVRGIDARATYHPAALLRNARFKRPTWEDMQVVRSYKIRGAYNKMNRLTQAQRDRGVVAASAGNHAQGLAMAAQRMGVKATIVMPRTTPQIKVDAVRNRGARVVLHGDSFDEAAAHAAKLVAEKNMTYVHPFDDPDVIAGQGTIGEEVLRQAHGGHNLCQLPGATRSQDL